ncbi:MAG: hypothetical protein QM758_06000 [Armatimonas sp.]
MTPEQFQLPLGILISIASILAMRYAWTPKNNVWWDRDSDGCATLFTQRVVIVGFFCLGIVFVLTGVGVIHQVRH